MGAGDDIIEGSAKQRSKRRVPALTWLHNNGTPLCRSSQPLAGLKGLNENKLKYPLLDAIQDTVEGSTLLIVDARPKLNARANAVKLMRNTCAFDICAHFLL
jgi:hypothetical protein